MRVCIFGEEWRGWESGSKGERINGCGLVSKEEGLCAGHNFIFIIYLGTRIESSMEVLVRIGVVGQQSAAGQWPHADRGTKHSCGF